MYSRSRWKYQSENLFGKTFLTTAEMTIAGLPVVTAIILIAAIAVPIVTLALAVYDWRVNDGYIRKWSME